MKRIDRVERTKLVKAMEYIARQVNDESIFYDYWLTLGVADGDINYGDLTVTDSDLEEFEVYTDDVPFADLMATFLQTMKLAIRSGGLYCDGIVSGE